MNFSSHNFMYSLEILLRSGNFDGTVLLKFLAFTGLYFGRLLRFSGWHPRCQCSMTSLQSLHFGTYIYMYQPHFLFQCSAQCFHSEKGPRLPYAHLIFSFH